MSLGCIDGNRYCLGIDFEAGVRDKLDNAQPKKPLHTFPLRNKLSFDQQIEPQYTVTHIPRTLHPSDLRSKPVETPGSFLTFLTTVVESCRSPKPSRVLNKHKIAGVTFPVVLVKVMVFTEISRAMH